jgi:hypothetical protein
MSAMEAEKAKGFPCKVADYNVNGPGNKFNFFTQDTKFKKRAESQPTLRVERFNNLNLVKLIADMEN